MQLKNFIHLYSLSKTLRFELKPVDANGKPLNYQYIQDFSSDYIKALIKTDEQRDKDYQTVKEQIDRLHKAYIEASLSLPGEARARAEKELIDKESGELFIKPGDVNISKQQINDAFNAYQQLKKNTEK